jgi:hypothetical protein
MPCGFGSHGVHRGILEEPVCRSHRAGLPCLPCQLPAHKKCDWQKNRHGRRTMDTATAQLRISRLGLPAR